MPEKLIDKTKDILLDASDYIGNRPEEFGADSHAIDTIRHNESFRAYVNACVHDYPDEYEDLSQKAAANIVWNFYKTWAY